MSRDRSGFNIMQSSRPTTTWLRGFAFVTLLLIGGSGIIFWRFQSVQLISIDSSSMSPLLDTGDSVVVKANVQPEAGDIISYYDPINQTKIDTQRVIRVDRINKSITTATDTVDKLSAPFSQSLMIGTVQYHVKKLGYVLNFLRSPAGLLAGVYLPALIILNGELRYLSNFYAKPTYRLMGYYPQTIKIRHMS